MGLGTFSYRRDDAVSYAKQWAFRRNPRYLDFSNMGGDCTNFASQCIYAGSGVMNYTQTFGWYYNSARDLAPAWTGVEYLYNFLTGNQKEGPFAKESPLHEAEPGDVIQLAIHHEWYHHSPVVVDVREPTPDGILLAAHSYDSLMRPLSSYDYRKLRLLHIEGVRKWQ